MEVGWRALVRDFADRWRSNLLCDEQDGGCQQQSGSSLENILEPLRSQQSASGGIDASGSDRLAMANSPGHLGLFRHRVACCLHVRHEFVGPSDNCPAAVCQDWPHRSRRLDRRSAAGTRRPHAHRRHCRPASPQSRRRRFVSGNVIDCQLIEQCRLVSPFTCRTCSVSVLVIFALQVCCENI